MTTKVTPGNRTAYIDRGWALFNWGSFCGVFRTRKEAIAEIKTMIGVADMSNWRSFFDIVRADITIAMDKPIRTWSRSRKQEVLHAAE